MSKSVSSVQADRIIETKFGTQSFIGFNAEEVGMSENQYISEIDLQTGNFNIPERSPGLIIHRKITETLEFADKQYPGAKENIFTAYIKQGAIVTQAQAAEISPDLHAQMIESNQEFVIATPALDEDRETLERFQHFTNLIGMASKLVTLSGTNGNYKQETRSDIIGGKYHGGEKGDEFGVTVFVEKPVIF